MSILENDLGINTAKLLLEIEAVHFNLEKPFTLTSGLKSPVYIDCRRIISYPKVRNTLVNFCCDIIVEKMSEILDDKEMISMKGKHGSAFDKDGNFKYKIRED